MQIKRISILFILLLSIVFLPLSTYAEPDYLIEPIYDDEIRFQGVEWGSSPAVVEQAIANMGIDVGEKKETSANSKFYSLRNDGYYEGDSWYELPGVKYNESFSRVPRYRVRYSDPNLELCKVAGHNVSSIITTYLPAYDVSQFQIDKSIDHMRIMRVEYRFSNNNKRLNDYDVFTDLLEKLTELYGKPTPYEAEYDIYIKYESYIWYGKNHTMLHLEFSVLKQTPKVQSVDLTYGYAGDYDDVRNIYSIHTGIKKLIEDEARNTELEKVQDNYDGL